LAGQLEKLKGIEFDYKAAQTVKVIKQWLNEGFNRLYSVVLLIQPIISVKF